MFRWKIFVYIELVLLVCLQFSLYSMRAYWGEINFNLSRMLGMNTNFILILGLLMGIPTFYVIYLLGKCKKPDALTHKILQIVIFVIFSVLFWYYLDQLGRERITLLHILSYFATLFALLASLILITLIVRFTSTTRQQYVFLSILLVVLLLPLFINSNITDKDLPSQPLVIAHRGGSQVAAENTLAALKIAHDFGVAGWEIDVRISADGIPFLMHDDDLKRTTNVEEVFPNRGDDYPETFTMAELKQLNAGSWFIEDDPYLTLSKYLSSEQIELIRKATIPTLAEVIAFSEINDAIVDIDFISPPNNHPNYSNFSSIVLEYFINSSIPHENLWVFTGSTDILDMVESKYPTMITGWGISTENPPSPEEIISQGYDGVNPHLALDLQQLAKYREAGLLVNIWTVNTKTQYSRFWIAGASSVVSDLPHVLSSMEKPIYSFSPLSYYLLWGLVMLAEISIFVYWKINYSNTD